MKFLYRDPVTGLASEVELLTPQWEYSSSQDTITQGATQTTVSRIFVGPGILGKLSFSGQADATVTVLVNSTVVLSKFTNVASPHFIVDIDISISAGDQVSVQVLNTGLGTANYATTIFYLES